MGVPIGHHSNFGPILSRFRDITGFLLRTSTPPQFRPNFGNVSLGLDYRRCVSRCEDPKLIIHVLNFELVQTDDLRWQYRAFQYVHRAAIKLKKKLLFHASPRPAKQDFW